MKEILIQKLHAYLVQNHLDLLIALQEEHRLDHYISGKVDSVSEFCESLQAENRPSYVIEALCLEELTRDLRPSRFNYMKELLAAEFESDYLRMRDSGILAYELINFIGACEPIFEIFAFGGENEDNPALKHAVRVMVAEYLER